jgi:hypothetical protein
MHGSIIDFRFRVKNQRLSLSDDYKDGDTFMENGILVERKYVDMTDDANLLLKRKQWTPNNVAEYFFFDEFGFLNISEKKIYECYMEFTEALKLIYSNIKSYYNKFAQRVITESDLLLIDFPRVIKEVELKGLEFYLDKERKDFLMPEISKIKKA